MITYRRKSTLTITVKRDGRAIGWIKSTEDGYTYYPNGKIVGGKPHPTLDECKQSLEDEQEVALPLKKRVTFPELKEQVILFNEMLYGEPLEIKKVRNPFPNGGVCLVTQKDKTDIFKTGLITMEDLLKRIQFAMEVDDHQTSNA